MKFEKPLLLIHYSHYSRILSALSGPYSIQLHIYQWSVSQLILNPFVNSTNYVKHYVYRMLLKLLRLILNIPRSDLCPLLKSKKINRFLGFFFFIWNKEFPFFFFSKYALKCFIGSCRSIYRLGASYLAMRISKRTLQNFQGWHNLIIRKYIFFSFFLKLCLMVQSNHFFKLLL